MAISILTVVGGLVSLYILSYFVALFRNIQRGRATGLPVLVCPVDPNNFLYLVAKVPLRPYMERFLPEWIYFHLRPSIYGWEFRDRWQITHPKMGPTFLMVTPGNSELWVADPQLGMNILQRRKDFVQQKMTGVIMDIMGPNVLSSNGEDWARQRRIIAPNLNERIMKHVWFESTKQAKEMLEHLLGQSDGTTCDTVDGLRAIAINVLGAVGYGQPKPWGIQEPNLNPDKMSYFDALSLVIHFLIEAALLPDVLLRQSFMPKGLRAVAEARKKVPVYGKQLLEDERASINSKEETSDNLMSLLVKLSDKGKELGTEKAPSATAQFLTEEEIQGNLFIFSAAGFDTTSNTMAYAVTLLALLPQWQRWIVDEIDRVYDSCEGLGGETYENTFSKLPRCMALMFETLRLYAPVGHLQRETDTPQTITYNGNTTTIPANVMIFINNQSIQCSPEIWGPDALEFRPTRWIEVDPSTKEEQLVSLEKGIFLPWSAGPRVCPGMKMAQVEFVTVFATCFRLARVEPALLAGENLEQATKRLEEVMMDSQNRLSLQMNRPKDVILKWTPRK